jgi:hypothetical protein
LGEDPVLRTPVELGDPVEVAIAEVVQRQDALAAFRLGRIDIPAPVALLDPDRARGGIEVPDHQAGDFGDPVLVATQVSITNLFGSANRALERHREYAVLRIRGQFSSHRTLSRIGIYRQFGWRERLRAAYRIRR